MSKDLGSAITELTELMELREKWALEARKNMFRTSIYPF